MTERPILFSGSMVRALLAGTKRQTRRLLQPRHLNGSGWPMPDGNASSNALTANLARYSPYGQPRDRLWVRETWHTSVGADGRAPAALGGHGWPVWYAADGHGEPRFTGAHDGGPAFLTKGKTRVSIHMPRWASRLTLEVTEVRVQRLQEISEEDARAEGVFHGNDLDRTSYTDTHNPVTTRDAFRALWSSINGVRADWASNPWVWAISFEVRP